MANARNDRGKAIEGIFSSPAERPGGKQYWLVKEIPGGRAEVQPVSERLIPQGPKKTITLGELLESYEPEPDFYVAKTYKKRPQSEGRSRSGVDIDLEGFELRGPPEEVEKNARAGFGIALAYLKRGNRAKAREILERLVGEEADYAPEHKHMLNDFGISLRKQRLPEASVKQYSRAMGLAGNDGNLHFNVARAYYEMGDYDRATEHLEKALNLDPGLIEARMFIEYIRRKRREFMSRVRLDDF